ncbi:Rieske 2Fe-2S domain-containing protein [Leptospira brenneri]|uniref:Rieske domain-containing protein n=1 Tax=Leptospira brenneri TaxID=2023182 RepID=A0A2M9XWZ2_9LEPT|nr:Rieske 2Fe-2S domain-containing protein [Leptospira brenneri]PJZ43840.1 hypothetical protein CH361_18355 [Leptospira brenneri]TGK92416.1 hypothetical protein EHQ30_13245 [Leptospira brenneri]
MQETWYLVCSSKDLPIGKILPFSTETQELILFRNQTNEVIALEGICSHLGAHLKNASWSTSGIVCPLHHLCFDSEGISNSSTIGQYKQKKFSTKETFGSIFVYIGLTPNSSFPTLDLIPTNKQMYQTFPQKTVSTNWKGILVNAFDPIHLEFVHKRKLIKKPEIIWNKKTKVIELRYTSQVIGKKLSDLLMKWISKNKIQVTIRCYQGLLFTVESDLGKIKSQLLLSLNPFSKETQISGVFVQKKSLPLLNTIRMFFARYLFQRFLFADIKPLEGMILNQNNLKNDPILKVIGSYIKTIDKSC